MNTKFLCPTYPTTFMGSFMNMEFPEFTLPADRCSLTVRGRSLLGDVGSSTQVSGKA